MILKNRKNFLLGLSEVQGYVLQYKPCLIPTCPVLLAFCLQLWTASVSQLWRLRRYSALRSPKQSGWIYQSSSVTQPSNYSSATDTLETCCQ